MVRYSAHPSAYQPNSHCSIQDLGSWRILNDYVENLYSKGDNDSITSCGTMVRSFLSEKNSIVADARSTAKHLQARGQFAEAAILERIQILFIENRSLFVWSRSQLVRNPSLFPGCNSSSLLADHIPILEALNDHASAQILQERLVASLTDEAQRKLAISKLWQLYHTSSDSVLSSIKRCLRKAGYNSPPREKLEDRLTEMDSNKMIPAIHQVLLTANNDLILEAVRGLDWPGAEDLFGSTALNCAILLNFVKGVRTLLNAGADVGGLNASLQTPLHVAASRSFKEIVEILIQTKADVDAINSCLQTPLHVAASRGYMDIVEILIQAKSDVDKEDILTKTPSHLAAANGHIHIIRILQENGADIEISDHIGRTPLAIAVECDQKAVVAFLVHRGAELKQLVKGRMAPRSLPNI
jgi:ankyrin repeat protein